MKKITKNVKTQNSDYIMHLDESTFWTKEIKSKKIGEQFSFSENCGKEEITYLAQFVTDGKGKYKVVIHDSEPASKGRSGWATAIFDRYEEFSQLPTNLRKAANEQGFTFKNGEFLKRNNK